MKVLLFANTPWYLYNFRLPLAHALRDAGHEVLLVSPAGPHSLHLEAAGFRWLEFPLSRRGLNPFSEGLALARLIHLYRRERPDLAHHFTIKCVLYGSAAARLTGVRTTINAVTGLGYVFAQEGERGRGLQALAKGMYRLALRNTVVIFQNPDDQQAFLQSGLVREDQIALIRGSGVDLRRFGMTPEPAGIPVVALPARLLWDKGVGVFVDAARALKAEGVQARFALLGDLDPDNPAGIPAGQLQAWQLEGVIEWWGWQDDMPPQYALTHIVCLPSYYREGVPKTLIEAAACGRAIVTADAPGCREAVRPGYNGLLVPPKDAAALAAALRDLIDYPDLRRQMGANGRTLAEAEFSVERVTAETLAVYGRAGAHVEPIQTL